MEVSDGQFSGGTVTSTWFVPVLVDSDRDIYSTGTGCGRVVGFAGD